MSYTIYLLHLLFLAIPVTLDSQLGNESLKTPKQAPSRSSSRLALIAKVSLAQFDFHKAFDVNFKINLIFLSLLADELEYYKE